MRKLTLAISICALTALAAPAQSGAIMVGVGDQSPLSFDSPYWGPLAIKQTRLITPWNGIFTDPARVDAWVQAAKAHGLTPLIAFEQSSDSKCPKAPCRAPSVSAYTKAFRAFHRKYPFIVNYQPWNEANSATQPVAHKPELAAKYYKAMTRNCKACRVVALDVLDSTSNLVKYVEAFKRRVGKPEPLLWGLHNYTDTNRQRTSGTENLLAITNGEVWLTETGGVVRFETQEGRVALPFDEQRAARAMAQMFTIARRFRDRITRIYTYQFQLGETGTRFDAGLLDVNGVPRPSYNVFKNGKPAAERIPFPKGVNKVIPEKQAPTKRKTGSGPQKHKCVPSPLGGCQG